MRIDAFIPLRRPRAFTLVELLVVIAIIALLAALAFPAFRGAKDTALRAAAASSLRQLAGAFVLFAGEHDQQLPGNFDTRNAPLEEQGAEDYKVSWLSGRNDEPSEVRLGPTNGTIFPYVGRSEKVYRIQGFRETAEGAGGSNGKFDFSMMLRLAGARLNNVPARARVRGRDVATPLLVQENPDRYINNNFREGAFGLADEVATLFGGGGYYAAIDGSVHFLRPPAGEAAYRSEEFEAIGPASGLWKSLGRPNLSEYGDWNKD